MNIKRNWLILAVIGFGLCSCGDLQMPGNIPAAGNFQMPSMQMPSLNMPHFQMPTNGILI